MKALDESVIIEVKARRKGQEIISESGLVIGVETQGEIPEHGEVVSVGINCQNISLGEIVLLPNGRMTHVPDPRVVSGEIKKDDKTARQLVTTHWKNIQVSYGNKNA